MVQASNFDGLVKSPKFPPRGRLCRNGGGGEFTFFEVINFSVVENVVDICFFYDTFSERAVVSSCVLSDSSFPLDGRIWIGNMDYIKLA